MAFFHKVWSPDRRRLWPLVVDTCQVSDPLSNSPTASVLIITTAFACYLCLVANAAVTASCRRSTGLSGISDIMQEFHINRRELSP